MNDLGSVQKSLQRTNVVSQIDIPHTLPKFRILQSSMLLRRWLQGFGHKVKLGRKHGQFPRVGTTQTSIDSDQVAEVQKLRQIKVGVGNLSLCQKDLDIAGPVPDIQEVQLASRAKQHDSASHSNHRPNFLARSLACLPCLVVDWFRRPIKIRQRNLTSVFFTELHLSGHFPYRLDEGPVIESRTPRVQSERLDFLELFKPCCLMDS